MKKQPRVTSSILFILLNAVMIISACQQTPGSPDHSDQLVYDQPLHGEYTGQQDQAPAAVTAADDPAVGLYRPHLELPTSYQKMGRVTRGKKAEITFVLHNTGSADLTVHRIYTTCSYVTAYLTASVIPPGRAALLIVTLDTGAYLETGSAVIQRGVVIESNDPYQPEATLWVQASIIP